MIFAEFKVHLIHRKQVSILYNTVLILCDEGAGLVVMMMSKMLKNFVKPVLSGHSKIHKTKVFKTNGTLMKVESIAECSLGAFCNSFDLH